MRANVVDQPALALANAGDIIDAERTLSIFAERSWQQAILDYRLAVRFFNFVYFWLDFPLIVLLGLVMYFTRRREYTFTRDAILASGLFALVCYYLYPVAPPRLIPELGIIDSLQAYNNLSYQAQSTEFFVNPYAAMPSLHVGWAFLLAIGVLRAYGPNRIVLLLAILHPLTQWTSTVVTGNHFFLDGVGGLVAAAAGISFATAMQRWGYPYARARLGIERRDAAGN